MQTGTNQISSALETKLRLKEKELNEMKINFQKERTALISSNQHLETDYAMLKDLYRQLTFDYNNYLRNNEHSLAHIEVTYSQFLSVSSNIFFSNH